MTVFRDSLGIAHHLPEPLLKAGIPAPPATEGAFRLLVDELIAFQERRRRMAEKVKVSVNTRDQKAEQQAEQISRADHMPSIRPGRPGAVRKSFAAMADELNEMVTATRAQTAEIQRQTAIAMLDDLDNAARAGRLGAIEAAKLDALRHRNARALNLEVTGVRA